MRRDRRRTAPIGRMARRSSPRRALVGACVGNVVEWYDYALYGAFATVLASSFFPSADRRANLLATFAVFSTAFLVRPAGALLFGGHGDRRGRRQVLSFAIILMSLATAGVGILPGYASIGLLAPGLLVLFRLAQGLSAGGEASAASAFAVEYAPANGRGWYGGWIWATLALGLAAGTGAATLLAWRLPQGVFETWGWRLAFLVALPLGLVGLYLRLRLDETPPFHHAQGAQAVARWPVSEALRAYPGRMLIGFALVAAASLTFNTFFIFLPNQLVAELGVPRSRALAGRCWAWRSWRPSHPPSDALRSGGPKAAAGCRNARPAGTHPADLPAHLSRRAGRLASDSRARQRPRDHLRGGRRAVRRDCAVYGHAPGTAHRQPGASRLLRHRRDPGGSHRGPADGGDRVPAAGCRRSLVAVRRDGGPATRGAVYSVGRSAHRVWKGMSQGTPAPLLDLEALAAEVTNFLDGAPVAETIGAKLARLLDAFLEGDVLPQAERAAGLGLDPTPLLGGVSEVLRLYADALERREPIDR